MRSPRAGRTTTEEMMYDAGLGDGDPEMHIGQLQEALLRNVRFISAIGLHTKGMTVEESKKMFLEQGMQDEGNAEQQANRGTFDPAYLNYTMGKLMIRKLRDDWCASRGGKAAWKQFHDTFLSYGGPPIPLVRKAMMGKDDNGTLFSKKDRMNCGPFSFRRSYCLGLVAPETMREFTILPAVSSVTSIIPPEASCRRRTVWPAPFVVSPTT